MNDIDRVIQECGVELEYADDDLRKLAAECIERYGTYMAATRLKEILRG